MLFIKRNTVYNSTIDSQNDDIRLVFVVEKKGGSEVVDRKKKKETQESSTFKALKVSPCSRHAHAGLGAAPHHLNEQSHFRRHFRVSRDNINTACALRLRIMEKDEISYRLAAVKK